MQHIVVQWLRPLGLFPLAAWTLRTRVMVLSLTLLTPTVILLFVVLETLTARIERQFRDDTFASYTLAAERLQRVLLDTRSELAALAVSRQVSETDVLGTAQILRTLYLGRDEVQVVFATDLNGDVYSSSHNLNAAQQVNISGAAFFADVITRGQSVITGPAFDSISNQSAIVIAVPVRNEIGQPTGLIAAVLSPYRLHNLMEQFLTHDGDRLAVYRADSEPLVSAGWSSPKVREQWRARAAAILPVRDSSVRLRSYSEGYAGPVALLGAGRISETPFAFILVREGGPLDVSLGTMFTRVVVYSVVAFLLTGLIAAKIAGWGSRPLAALTIAVSQISEGRLDAALRIAVRDTETRRLVSAFNRMATSLRERDAQVTAQRTELHEYNVRLRDLLAQVLHAQEDERQRISADLHDTVAQQITGAHYEIQTALAHERRGDSAGAGAALDRATAILRAMSIEMRRVIHSLRPEALERRGLGPAIMELARTYSALPHRIDVTAAIQGEPYSLSWSQELAFYRTAQESLNNAWKHASGATVRVRLTYAPGSVELMVSDTGPGFVPVQLRESSGDHFGLVGMRKRLEQAGGTLTVRSTIGQGTMVRARIARSAASREEQRDPTLDPAATPVSLESGR